MNLFFDAQLLKTCWSFLDLGVFQPFSPPTTNSVQVMERNLNVERRRKKRNSLEVAIVLDFKGAPFSLG